MNKIKINIKINNEDISQLTYPNILLSDFLRYQLNMTGTHIGCDTSQCGSCIVMVDKKCIKSCSVLLAQCNNKSIKTVESLGKQDNLHEVQKAFKKHHGLQCGFCTPGILFTSLEMAQNKNIETEEQIRDFLDGNLCRCTGYQNIVKSIKSFLKNKNLSYEKV
tara:strand:- start:300 stop:788 length:489 start_codon:yes stop_codon:yes gene_type:complete